jgi:phosphoglucosamine mutase
MRASGHNLGGEQSGHIIMTDFATTGDGLLAGLQMLAVMRRQERPMSEFGRAFEPLPQRLRNCRLNGGRPLEEADVQSCIAAAEARLNGRGRMLVRPSGTEPLIRVMVEADDEGLLVGVLDEVAGTIERYA